MNVVYKMFTKLVVLTCLLAVAHSRYVNHGIFSSRIVGGQDAEPGEFPHQASLQVGLLPEIGSEHFCGGTILNERWILTAIHCVEVFEATHEVIPVLELYVKVGKHDLNIAEDEEQYSIVQKYFKHPMYPGNGAVITGDIALLKLSTPLTLNDRVAAAKLPEMGSDPTGDMIVTGWGVINNATEVEQQISSDILQTVTVPILDRDVCSQAINDVYTEESKEANGVHIDITTICTGPLTGGISVCSGDSGGPLVSRNKNNEVEVVGVISWAVMPCGRPRSPTGGFVRVGSFVNWIIKTMQEN